MSEVHSFDWSKAENQQPIFAALKEARGIVVAVEASGQLDLITTKVVMGLVQTAQFSYSNLILASETESISLMAWCARCLLEAEIWMQYVTASKANAERFHNDWLNDASETLDCYVPASDMNAQQLADMIVLYGKTQMESEAEYTAKARAVLADSRKSVTLDDEDFLRISAVARELGHAEWFGRYNKMLSKYVHATAFSVLSFPSEKLRTNTSNMLLYHGAYSCLRLVGSLNTFLKSHSLRPIF
jgi:hypothetical protein